MDPPVSHFHKHVSGPGKLHIQNNFTAKEILVKCDAFIEVRGEEMDVMQVVVHIYHATASCR